MQELRELQEQLEYASLKRKEHLIMLKHSFEFELEDRPSLSNKIFECLIQKVRGQSDKLSRK